jgi:predicted ATPase
MKRVVLTGGPGAGKTEVSRRLTQRYPNRIVAVPEAATQIYLSLQTRWDQLDAPSRRRFQRDIYRLQVEQEKQVALKCPGAILLMDRGTVDGSIYWPDGPANFWPALGIDHRAELGRYDLAIWMESCAAIGAYDGAASNRCRSEDAAAAIRSGEALLEVWAGHRQLVRIGAFPHIDQKVAAVEAAIFAAR